MRRPRNPSDRTPTPSDRPRRGGGRLHPNRGEVVSPATEAVDRPSVAGGSDGDRAIAGRLIPDLLAEKLRPGIGEALPKGNTRRSLFERLDKDVPLTLFPVRLETVFDREMRDGEMRDLLKIRVYPDDIHIEDHDPRLTSEERAAGERFWALYEAAAQDEAAQAAAMDWLIELLSEKRATYVAKCTAEGAERPRMSAQAGNRPAVARALPKFWKAVGFRRTGDGTLEEAFSIRGAGIPKVLCVDPVLGEMESATSPAGRTALWISDFDAAKAVGMGMEVDLTGRDWLHAEGIALLMVYGVRGTASEAQSQEVQGLLEAHRFSSGLAFAGQGVATNSVEENRSAVPAHFAAPDGTMESLFAEPAIAPETNAIRVAGAIGVDASATLSVIEGAERDEDGPQAAMNEALWPVTWGQYFETLMRNEGGKRTLPKAVVDVARARFLSDVRGAGPLPALRVGSQPYGLLPVRAHSVPKAWVNTDPWFEFLLVSLRDIWLAASGEVAKLSPTGDGARDERLDEVVRVLSGVPHPARFLVRGLEDWRKVADTNPWLDLGYTLLGLLWLTVDDPTFGAQAQSILGQWGWGRAILGDGWDGEGQLEAVGVGLSQARLEALDGDDVTSHDAQRLALEQLKQTVRALSLPAQAKQSAEVWIDHMLRQVDRHAERLDPYLGALPIKSVVDVDGVLRNGSKDPILAYHLYNTSSREFTNPLALGVSAEDTLAPTDIPERYLKLAAGRVGNDSLSVEGTDALIKPFATAKPMTGLQGATSTKALKAMRSTPAPSIVQPSVALAVEGPNENDDPLLKQLIDAAVPALRNGQRRGFKRAVNALADLPAASLEWHMRETLGLASNRLDAWLTSLATRRLRDVAGAGDADSLCQFGGYGFVLDLKPGAASESDGFLHAPTMAQAATGAIMRSAWLGHGKANEESPLAVDLSSKRLRMADRLFSGVSQGREVGEILGQDVERALHDSGDDAVLYDLRLAVLDASETPKSHKTTGPVDGLELIDAYEGGGLDGFLSGLGNGERRTRVIAAITEAKSCFDALGDAGLFEATHYVAQGNMARANAVMNALSLGEALPSELRHARTDISKSQLEHKVVLAVPEFSATAATPDRDGRGLSHPGLAHYVDGLVGKVPDISLSVVAGDTVHDVALKALDLAPLDLVMEAAKPGALGRHACAYLISQGVNFGAAPYVPSSLGQGAGADAGTQRVSDELEDFEELAVSIAAHLGALRAAKPEDFGQSETHEADLLLVAPLERRLSALIQRAKARLDAVRDNYGRDAFDALCGDLRLLACEGARDALSALTLSQSGDSAAYVRFMDGLISDLAARVANAEVALADEARTALTLKDAIISLSDQSLAFEAPLSTVKLPIGARLGFTPPAQSALLDWAGTYAHVREDMRRWCDATDTSALISGRLPWPLALSQVTAEPCDVWQGGAFGDEGAVGGASYVAVDAGGWRKLASGQAACAYVIDGWTERLPDTEATTGLTFHFDAPSSKAPQSVLLAVTPNEESGWDEALLQRTLIETVENAQLRAVTNADLDQFGHHLPAIFVPGGLKAGPQPPETETEDAP